MSVDFIRDRSMEEAIRDLGAPLEVPEESAGPGWFVAGAVAGLLYYMLRPTLVAHKGTIMNGIMDLARGFAKARGGE